MNELSIEEKKVFNNILKLTNENYINHIKMEKGVHSKVFLLNNKYIIKYNDMITIKGEVVFFTNNKNKYNEEVLLYDQNQYRYIVYKFIENNEIAKRKINIDKLRKQIKEYVFSLKEYNWNGYGYLFEEKESWKEFFSSEMISRKHNAFKVLPKNEYCKVEKALKIIDKYKFKTVILHGDLGMHNLLFMNNKLAGIIDPQPIAGDRIYDYLFFIFSDILFCKNISLAQIYNDLEGENIEKINALIVLILFDRIIRCIRHNLFDIEEYLKLWDTYSNII